MANLLAPKIDLKDAVISLLDGTATPNELVLKMDDGNINFDRNRNVEYILDRGKLSATREGDEVPLALTFNSRFSEITSSTGLDVSVYEFLNFTGAAATNVSTGANPCDKPKAIDVQVVLARACTVGTDVLQDETIIFPAFRFESINGDFGAGQFNVSGSCNVLHPTSTRSDPA